MSWTTIALGNLIIKSPYWLIDFGKCLSLAKISSMYMAYSFHKLLIFFKITLVNIFYLKFDFSLHPRRLLFPCCVKEILNITTYSKGNKRWNKSKEKHILTCLRCWSLPMRVFNAELKLPEQFYNHIFHMLKLKQLLNTYPLVWTLTDFLRSVFKKLVLVATTQLLFFLINTIFWKHTLSDF